MLPPNERLEHLIILRDHLYTVKPLTWAEHPYYGSMCKFLHINFDTAMIDYPELEKLKPVEFSPDGWPSGYWFPKTFTTARYSLVCKAVKELEDSLKASAKTPVTPYEAIPAFHLVEARGAKEFTNALGWKVKRWWVVEFNLSGKGEYLNKHIIVEWENRIGWYLYDLGGDCARNNPDLESGSLQWIESKTRIKWVGVMIDTVTGFTNTFCDDTESRVQDAMKSFIKNATNTCVQVGNITSIEIPA